MVFVLSILFYYLNFEHSTSFVIIFILSEASLNNFIFWLFFCFVLPHQHIL